MRTQTQTHHAMPNNWFVNWTNWCALAGKFKKWNFQQQILVYFVCTSVHPLRIEGKQIRLHSRNFTQPKYVIKLYFLCLFSSHFFLPLRISSELKFVIIKLVRVLGEKVNWAHRQRKTRTGSGVIKVPAVIQPSKLTYWVLTFATQRLYKNICIAIVHSLIATTVSASMTRHNMPYLKEHVSLFLHW